MGIRRGATALLAAATVCASASPALATRWLVAGIGTITAAPTPPGQTALAGVNLAGQFAGFQLVVNDALAGAPLSPPGGVGSVKSYVGAVESFVLATSLGGMTLSGVAPGTIFIYDNVAGSPGNLLDQMTFNTGVSYANGFQPQLLTDLVLPDNSSVTQLAFGRTASAPSATPPQMLTSSDFPTLPDIWQSAAAGMFFTFDIRQGTAANATELRALPVARFNVSQLNFSITEITTEAGVPEPATWAMLIAGFGLVGAALRRSRPGVRPFRPI